LCLHNRPWQSSVSTTRLGTTAIIEHRMEPPADYKLHFPNS